MKTIKNKLLLSTALILCVQFVAPAFADSQIPISLMPRFYQAIDTGNFADVKAILNNTRAALMADKTSANYQLDLEFRDEYGNTPLIRAAAQGNTKTVRYLTQLGADINAYNVKSETPLIKAYNAGNYEVAKYLLSKGAVDNYQVAQKLQELETKVIETKEASANNATKWELGIGAALIGGGIAAAAGGGGGGSSSSSSGSGGSIPPSSNPINAPANLDPTSFVTAAAQNEQGILAENAQYAYARGYDGSLYSRSANGTLTSNTAVGSVKVAVVDSGVDLTHPIFGSNTILTSSSVTCGDSGCVSGGGAKYVAGAASTDATYNEEVALANHGTWVASIIAGQRIGVDANGVGMEGIAPGAQIMSIGFYDPTYGTTPPGSLTHGDVAGIQYAINNGAQVINGSYGISGVTIQTADVASLNAFLNTTYAGTTLMSDYQQGVAKHMIFVYAAGNDYVSTSPTLALDPIAPAGLPYYFQGKNPFTLGTTAYTNYNTLNPTSLDWSKNFLAVVSVDKNNVISSFSNRCGVAMNWCLAAPGEISYVAGYTIPAVSQPISAQGYYANVQGTSFAAPNVSGAVAIMLGAFPQLTPEKVVRILLNTATDLGAAGVDPIYGYGLINLQKATNPTDTGWTIASVGASTPISFYTSGFSLSAPFGNALAKNTASLMFLDAYGKNYAVPLSAVSGNLAPRKTSFDKFNEFASNDFANVINLSDSTKVSFSNAPAANGIDKATNNNFSKFSFQSSSSMGSMGQDNLSLSFNYKTNLANSVGNLQNPTIPQNLMASDAYKNPYLAVAGEEVSSSVVGYKTGHWGIRSTSYFGNMNDQYDYRFGNKNAISGVFNEYSYTSNDKKSKISLNSGVLIEQNSILGSETSGAFAIDSASTYHAGVSGKYEVAKDVSLIGNYNLGLTKVSASSDSIFTNFNNVTTNSMAAGVEFANVKAQHDVLGFAASQPLRVTSGNTNLTLPNSIDSNGTIGYQNQKLNLAATGRESDIESYYHVKLTAASELSLNGILRFSPNNDATAKPDATIFGKYRLEF